MSIAAVSSSFVAALRDRAPVAPVPAVAAPLRAAHAHREGGRRHELVDAMSQVLGEAAPQDRAGQQVVFRFAQALMHDLRSIDAGAAGDGPGRGRAWGRRDWSDLPQRIDALAAAAGAATPEPVAAVETVAAEAPPPEMPQQPNPVTTTSAALHLMQVPSSRLLEAFAALREALGAQDKATQPDGEDMRGELAGYLVRLAELIAPDAPAELPAGSVLDVTA